MYLTSTNKWLTFFRNNQADPKRYFTLLIMKWKVKEMKHSHIKHFQLIRYFWQSPAICIRNALYTRLNL